MKTAQRIFLKNGSPVTLRLIQAKDVDLLETMHGRLSEQSIYTRYLRPHAPTREEIAGMCNLPYHMGSGFVAIIENPYPQIIGMGYYVTGTDGDPNMAEPAIVVEDAFQAMGLGAQIFQTLAESARARGITQFACFLSTANEACIRLIRRSGYSYTGKFAYGTRELIIDLQGERVTW